MAKASEPGRTKTRLAPPLSYDEAALFNTAFLRDVSANILAASAASAAGSIAGYMAYGPPGREDFFADHMPAEIARFECWHANFGDCLHAAIQELFARGHMSAVVLNADSPTLPTSILIETARLLAAPGDRAVLGPSSDGGYYLLGLKNPHRALFDGIAWSTDTVADETRARARRIGLPMQELPVWYDVDDAAALRQARAELFDGASYHPELKPHAAVNTRVLMAALRRTSDLDARLATGLAAAASPTAAVNRLMETGDHERR